ncbi:MAG: hypothetical protein Q6K99_05265 [Thermostichales cyanobacterium BF4_bins_65]
MGITNSALATLWAKKYVNTLGQAEDATVHLCERIRGSLRFASSQAWAKTEQLLAPQLEKQRLDPDWIDPWQIAEDSRQLFKRAAGSCQTHISPEKFSTDIARVCGQIRQRYSSRDPRLLGFMSMQFHYTGQILLESLSPREQSLFLPYLKVMDDHLYMPLHRCYQAAAALATEDTPPPLRAMQELLPAVTPIAETICADAAHAFPGYHTLGGSLSQVMVRVSSIRDVEMFQIYLGLAVLEGSIRAVQQELFPLCVMLYPPLRVGWDLVRYLLAALEKLLPLYLSSSSYALLAPYLQQVQGMFSTEVFPEADSIWNHHPDVLRFLDMAQQIQSSL